MRQSPISVHFWVPLLPTHWSPCFQRKRLVPALASPDESSLGSRTRARVRPRALIEKSERRQITAEWQWVFYTSARVTWHSFTLCLCRPTYNGRYILLPFPSPPSSFRVYSSFSLVFYKKSAPGYQWITIKKYPQSQYPIFH